MTQVETERKFIIEKPLALNGLEYADIEQIYLTAARGTRRVRMMKTGDVKKYYFTEKIRRSALSALETEREIDEKTYLLLLKEADKSRNPVQKRRYYYPFKQWMFEIDIYPFWQKQCVLEVELQSEKEEICFPPDIKIIKEVSLEKEYKNFALAKKVPAELI